MERMTYWDYELDCYCVKTDKKAIDGPTLYMRTEAEKEMRFFGSIIDRLAIHEDKWYTPTTTAAQPEQPEQPKPIERMTREKVLEAAKRCVCGDREQDYGTPEQNFQTIANLWIDYLRAKDDPLDIEPHDVAAMLGLLKIARISSGHGKADNWIDLAGYAACGGELEGLTE